jgi:ubiquinone/menaquinone biosynthesis C-methylase UbiE
MDEAEFDKFADEYRALHAENIWMSGEDPEYFAEYKVVDILTELKRSSIRARRALDFGAGIGYSVPYFVRHMPETRLTCLDVSRKSLDVGVARYGAAAEFRHFDGQRIPYDDDTFEVALASCVFHHIPREQHVPLLAEIRRVLVPGGQLLVYEHNPLNPLTRHAVNTCEFDEHAELIGARTMQRRAAEAGFGTTDVRYRVFFPRALSRFRGLEAKLTWLPFGAQYYVLARKS